MTREQRPSPFVLVVASLALGIALSACGERQSKVSMEDTCSNLADSLGMPHPGAGKLTETEEGYEYTDGELLCRFDGHSNLTTITCFALASNFGEGVALVKDKQRAIEVARAKLEKTAYSLDGEVRVTELPWDEKLPEVSVIAEPRAYGYSTNGYAGRIEVVVNRFTENVTSIDFILRKVPDRPNILVTEGNARGAADALFNASQFRGKKDETRAKLGYFVAYGENATAAGARYREENRVRMCWIVSYLDESGDHSASMTITFVAVDAETGEVLKNP